MARSDVTVICGHNTISMVCGNTAYCVKSTGEDLSRRSNKIESVGLRKCPIIIIIISIIIIIIIIFLFFYTPGSKDPRGYYYGRPME